MKSLVKHFTSITTLLLIVFAIRLLLSLLPPFEIDINGWRFWSLRMAEVGPGKFYSPDIFTDNPPGFLYVFWLVGLIKNIFFPNLAYASVGFDFLIKLPTTIFDMATAYLIYQMVKQTLTDTAEKVTSTTSARSSKTKAKTKKPPAPPGWTPHTWGIMAFLLYALNPALIFNTNIWGQFDGAATFFMVLAVYYALMQKKAEYAALAFAVAWAIKPQAIGMAPAFGLLVLVNFPFKRWLTAGVAFVVAVAALYLPFFPTNLIHGLQYVTSRMTNLYTATTAFAFNYWGIFGNWGNDLDRFANLTLLTWGFILLSVALLPLYTIRPIKAKFEAPLAYLTCAVTILAFFTFMTRMHERYVFPFFAFFLLAAITLRSRFLLVVYALFTVIHLLNLLLPYLYYNKEPAYNPALTDLLMNQFRLLSFVTVISCIILLVTTIRMAKKHKTLTR